MMPIYFRGFQPGLKIGAAVVFEIQDKIPVPRPEPPFGARAAFAGKMNGVLSDGVGRKG